MAKVKGEDVALLLSDDEYTAICARSITFNLERETIETSITSNGWFRTFTAGPMTWSGELEGLSVLVNGTTDQQTIEVLYERLLSGVPVLARWYEEEETHQYYLNKSGYIIITNISEIASFDNVVTFNASFKGTGPITITTGNI